MLLGEGSGGAEDEGSLPAGQASEGDEEEPACCPCEGATAAPTSRWVGFFNARGEGGFALSWN